MRLLFLKHEECSYDSNSVVERDEEDMFNEIWKFIMELRNGINRNHLKAYAAESAFFLVISLVPSILFLLTLVQFTPIPKSMILELVQEVFPQDISGMILSIVEEVYNQSISVLPVTALVALWSAGKGVLSMASGLNWVYGKSDKKNYIYLRLRASAYTLVFVVAIILSLLILVFGNRIGDFLIKYIPIIEHVIRIIIDLRIVFAIAVLTSIFTLAYKILPQQKVRIRQQIPGACFAAVGWIGISYALSIYVDVFKGFSNMYGSLATIVLIMLWIYFCMYAMLIGAEINVYIEKNMLNETIGKHIVINSKKRAGKS